MNIQDLSERTIEDMQKSVRDLSSVRDSSPYYPQAQEMITIFNAEIERRMLEPTNKMAMA